MKDKEFPWMGKVLDQQNRKVGWTCKKTLIYVSA